MQYMITYEQALEIVSAVSFRVEPERIGFMETNGRILSEDIASDIEMPPFDKSAVDGYACRKSDILNELEVIEVIPAGKAPEKEIRKNQCAKIMTGAPLPIGSDTVIMVEDVEEIDHNRIRYKRERVKNNICFKGEDIRKGEVVLKAGTLIQPQHIAVMATAGCVNPMVYRRIKVAVISTGDELVEPEAIPSVSQIRNSNAYQLLSQAVKIGMDAEYIGIASDNEAATRETITNAFKKADVVLLTGGVSMGDFDFVPKVLTELGVEIKFKSIAVQPGRPTVFGTKGNQFIFGLPGNPVSSFVQFELLVKPLIYTISGCDYQPLKLKMPIVKEFTRKRSDRLSIVPVRITEDGEVKALEYHGSAHINSLTEAQGLMFVPLGVTSIKKGEKVDVRLI